MQPTARRLNCIDAIQTLIENYLWSKYEHLKIMHDIDNWLLLK